MTEVDDAFARYVASFEYGRADRAFGLPEHQGIRELVAGGWTLRDTFLAGSYDRAPRTRRVWDVDIYVEIDPAGPQARLRTLHPSVALVELRAILLGRHPRVSTDEMACTVRLGHGAAVTSFDVVPAFEREDGGFDVPDTNRSQWVRVAPRILRERGGRRRTDADPRFSAGLTAFVTLLERINSTFDEPVVPAFLEVMAHALVSPPFGRYQDEIAWFCASAVERLDENRLESSTFGSAVVGTMPAVAQGQAAKWLADWHRVAANAVRLEDTGKPAAALKEWATLLGW